MAREPEAGAADDQEQEGPEGVEAAAGRLGGYVLAQRISPGRVDFGGPAGAQASPSAFSSSGSTGALVRAASSSASEL